MKTNSQLAPDATGTNDHISSVRRMLLDQMAALRTARTPEALKAEVARSNALGFVAQSITAIQKVEVEYLKVTGQKSATFLGSPARPERPESPALASGYKQGQIERWPGGVRHTISDDDE